MTMPAQLIHGRPTGPIVRVLLETFGHERGTRFTHDQIVAVVKEPRGSHRYRTIIGAWRRELLNTCGVHLASVPNEGYEMVDAQAQVLHGVRKFEQGKRAVRKSVQVIAASPDSQLDEAQRRAKVHALGIAAASLTTMRDATKDSSRLLAALAPRK